MSTSNLKIPVQMKVHVANLLGSCHPSYDYLKTLLIRSQLNDNLSSLRVTDKVFRGNNPMVHMKKISM